MVWLLKIVTRGRLGSNPDYIWHNMSISAIFITRKTVR